LRSDKEDSSSRGYTYIHIHTHTYIHTLFRCGGSIDDIVMVDLNEALHPTLPPGGAQGTKPHIRTLEIGRGHVVEIDDFLFLCVCVCVCVCFLVNWVDGGAGILT
jgi:hypothetical protein